MELPEIESLEEFEQITLTLKNGAVRTYRPSIANVYLSKIDHLYCLVVKSKETGFQAIIPFNQIIEFCTWKKGNLPQERIIKEVGEHIATGAEVFT